MPTPVSLSKGELDSIQWDKVQNSAIKNRMAEYDEIVAAMKLDQTLTFKLTETKIIDGEEVETPITYKALALRFQRAANRLHMKLATRLVNDNIIAVRCIASQVIVKKTSK